MGIYPDLNEAMKPAKTTASFKKLNQLAFSSASQVTDFETVNDKVLREMNERARKQLENKVQSTVNPFKLGGDTARSRSPQRPRSAANSASSKRFSILHKSQFNRMESIESHPKVVAKNSRRNLRSEFTKEPQGVSPAKRGQTKPEESPTKRLRQSSQEPKPITRSTSQVFLRSQRSRTELKKKVQPELELPKDAKEPKEVGFMKRSETSERIRARASMRGLRGPVLPRPEMKELPREEPIKVKEKEKEMATKSRTQSKKELQRTEKPGSRVAAQPLRRLIRSSRSHRDLHTLKPDYTEDTDSSILSDMSLSHPSPGAAAPIPRSRSVWDFADFPSIPKHIPSYARPTASAMRRSQSQQTIGKPEQEPSRVVSMLKALPRAPRKNPRS